MESITINFAKIAAVILTIVFMANGHIDSYVGTVLLILTCGFKVKFKL